MELPPARRSLALATLALAAACAAPRTAATTAPSLALPAAQDAAGPATPDAAPAEDTDAEDTGKGQPLEVRVLLGGRQLADELAPVEEPWMFGAELGYTPRGWGDFSLDLGLQYALDADDEVFPGAFDLALATAELYAGPRYTLRADALFHGALQPYVGGGVSLVSVMYEDAFGSDFRDGTAGLYGLVGLRWAFENVALGLEYRVLTGTQFEDSDGLASIDTDVDYDQLALVIAIFL